MTVLIPCCRHCYHTDPVGHVRPCPNCLLLGEDMSTKLNVKSEEIHGDVPEGGERVKLIISEAHLTSHTESAVTHERNVERVREIGLTELRMHALNYAMSNTYVVERTFDKAEGGAKPTEYAAAMIEMAEVYLAWLTTDEKCEDC